MVFGFAKISLALTLVPGLCPASGKSRPLPGALCVVMASCRALLTCLIAEHAVQYLQKRDLPNSSLPVIVTANATQSTSYSEAIGEPIDTPISSVVTATHVVLTTTTVFTTIFSKAKETTFSPTNALQVLSAAERSFSIQNVRSDLPPIVTDASTGTSKPDTSIRPSSASTSGTSDSLLSSQVNEKPATHNMSGLPSIIIRPTIVTLNRATSATARRSNTLSINHEDTTSVHGSLASNDRTTATAASLSASISASGSRSISSDLVPSTLTVQNRIASISSATNTGGTPQATATISSSISVQKSSLLRTAFAAITALSFWTRMNGRFQCAWGGYLLTETRRGHTGRPTMNSTRGTPKSDP